MKNIRNLGEAFLMAIIIMLGISACVNDTIVYPEDPEIPDTVTVSFNDVIIPIFDNNCIDAGCHDGSWNPDLTASNAYNSLTSGIPKDYLNTDNPKSSILYIKISPGESMEQFITSGERASILRWIEQGALNN
jgi:hypothetical protein